MSMFVPAPARRRKLSESFTTIRRLPCSDRKATGCTFHRAALTDMSRHSMWLSATRRMAGAAGRRVATVTTQTLYVRSEPSTEASVLGMVPGDDDLTVVDESTAAQGWVKVSIDEGDGYVSTQYVTLSTEYKYAESKAEEEARLAREAAEREAAAEAARKSAAKRSASSKSSSSGKSYSAPSGSSGSSVDKLRVPVCW